MSESAVFCDDVSLMCCQVCRCLLGIVVLNRMSVKNSKFYDLYYAIVNSNLAKHYASLNDQISRNFRYSKVDLRRASSNGLWCACLLPAILTINAVLYDVSSAYKQVAFLSIGLLCYSMVFIIFISLSCMVLRERVFGGCMASTLFSTVLMYTFRGLDLIPSFILSAMAVYSYNIMLRRCLVKFPKTFTIGEAMILTQGITLSAMSVICKVKFDPPEENIDLVSAIVITALLTVGLICTGISALSETERTLTIFFYILTPSLLFGVAFIHILLGTTCVFQVLNFIMLSQIRLRLLVCWAGLLLLTAAIIVTRTKAANRAKSSTRKIFHILASIVFLSGIVIDLPLMKLSAGLGLAALFFVETLRVSQIEPISPVLQAAFETYRDEKDCGVFAMTPIYLFIGLASPLVMVPDHPGQELELLSGVVTIGIGDSAASFFGERYGINKWPDGTRTMEGTACNILSQLVFVYMLGLFDFLPASNCLIRASVAASITGLVEAQTEQVDNLILPLVALLAFQATFFLAY